MHVRRHACECSLPPSLSLSLSKPMSPWHDAHTKMCICTYICHLLSARGLKQHHRGARLFLGGLRKWSGAAGVVRACCMISAFRTISLRWRGGCRFRELPPKTVRAGIASSLGDPNITVDNVDILEVSRKFRGAFETFILPRSS
jgi:hypothetical protein